MLNEKKHDLAVSYLRFRVLYLKKWTVRAESLKSALDNWICLENLWEKSLSESLDSEMRGRIIGVKTQKETFNNFYHVNDLQLV